MIDSQLNHCVSPQFVGVKPQAIQVVSIGGVQQIIKD